MLIYIKSGGMNNTTQTSKYRRAVSVFFAALLLTQSASSACFAADIWDSSNKVLVVLKDDSIDTRNYVMFQIKKFGNVSFIFLPNKLEVNVFPENRSKLNDIAGIDSWYDGPVTNV